jgi:hypothetical protein
MNSDEWWPRNPSDGKTDGVSRAVSFRVAGCLGEQGVRLTPDLKREIFTLFGRRPTPPHRSWLRREGQLVMRGALPLSMDPSAVSRELRYWCRPLQRPQGVVRADSRYQHVLGFG